MEMQNSCSDLLITKAFSSLLNMNCFGSSLLYKKKSHSFFVFLLLLFLGREEPSAHNECLAAAGELKFEWDYDHQLNVL